MPWPDEIHVRAVIARESRPPYGRSILLTALDQRVDESAALARRTLARRWPGAEAVVVDKTPVEGILHEAERFRADLIAVGWRGHGTARRLLMGSVSRGVVRGAKCAVLVVRQRPRRVRRIVIGFDASPNAQRAVELVARLVAPPDGHLTLVSVAEILAPSSHGPSVGGIRSTIAREVRRINAEGAKAATNALNRAATELERSRMADSHPIADRRIASRIDGCRSHCGPATVGGWRARHQRCASTAAGKRGRGRPQPIPRSSAACTMSSSSPRVPDTPPDSR